MLWEKAFERKIDSPIATSLLWGSCPSLGIAGQYNVSSGRLDGIETWLKFRNFTPSESLGAVEIGLGANHPFVLNVAVLNREYDE